MEWYSAEEYWCDLIDIRLEKRHCFLRVRQFLTDIIRALGLKLLFRAEITISHTRPDIAVLLMGRFLMVVVEVNKPGSDILARPAVLGELLDQMFLVEGFYGTGPVIGILTTGDD